MVIFLKKSRRAVGWDGKLRMVKALVWLGWVEQGWGWLGKRSVVGSDSLDEILCE